MIGIVNWPAVAKSTIFCRMDVLSTPLTKLCLDEISDLIELPTLGSMSAAIPERLVRKASCPDVRRP